MEIVLLECSKGLYICSNIVGYGENMYQKNQFENLPKIILCLLDKKLEPFKTKNGWSIIEYLLRNAGNRETTFTDSEIAEKLNISEEEVGKMTSAIHSFKPRTIFISDGFTGWFSVSRYHQLREFAQEYEKLPPPLINEVLPTGFEGEYITVFTKKGIYPYTEDQISGFVTKYDQLVADLQRIKKDFIKLSKVWDWDIIFKDDSL